MFGRSLRKPVIFIIAVLLIFGTFFSTLTFIPSPKKAHAVGNTYYVRADGTAVDKTTAIGPATDATATMNLAVYHTQAFSPGDTIYFSAQGGDYTTATTLAPYTAGIHIISSGDADNYINYEGIEGDVPLVDVSANAASAYGILVNSQSYVNVRNFQVKGSGGNGGFRAHGTSGQEGYAVKAYDINVLSNHGASSGNNDCFSLDNTAQVEFHDITATQCRPDPSTGVGSHQALTAHNDSKLKVYTANFSDSNYWYVGVQNSQAEIHNLTASSSRLKGFATSGPATNHCWVYDSVLNVDSTGGFIGSAAGVDGELIIQNSTINITGTSGIDNVGGNVFLNNSAININALNYRMYPFYAGHTTLTGNEINLINAGTSFFRTESADNSIDFTGNTIVGGGTADTPIYYRLNGGTVKNNIFKNWSGATQLVLIDTISTVNFYNNTSWNSAIAGTAIKQTAGILNLSNNIFYNTTNVLNPVGGTANISYNDYYNSSDEGGVGSILTDPQFVTPGTDFNLQSNSPAIDAGLDTSITTDYAGKQRYDDPDVANTGSGAVPYYDIGAYEYVTPPSPAITSSTHPSQTSWYESNTPAIAVTPTTSTTSYHYLVNQTAVPLKADVEAGTASASGAFTVPDGVITTDGVWYVHMIGQNLDGDFSTNFDSYTIKYDGTAPTTSMTPNPLSPNGANGWYVTQPSITLLATDLVSGINAILYHWDTGSVYAYSMPIVAPEGTHTLYYYSVNNAGNVSLTGSQVFKTSLFAPNFSNLPGDTRPINLTDGEVITDANFIIKVLPTDTSGIEKVEFSVDDNLICTETDSDIDGVYSCAWDTTIYHSDVKVIAYDLAGQTSTLTRTVIVASALPDSILPETGGLYR